MKDEDSHQFGGECEAFKEEDLRMRIEKAKREDEEKKRKEIESKRRVEQESKKRQEMEQRFEDNFNMDEIDNERGNSLHDKLPKTNNIKAGGKQLATGAPRQTNLSNYMNPTSNNTNVS